MLKVFEKQAMRKILGLRGRIDRGLQEVTLREVSMIYTLRQIL
jgi:hypothetical protein